jgi:ABC-type antimicrobial peptide transport system permease subunit
VIAYVVTLRTREFGIRMALGAGSGRVVRLVAGRGAGLIAMGLGIGWASALALSRFLTSVLYGVTAADAGTFSAMGLLLAAVAIAACVAPARRAGRVDPAVALRSE